MRLLSQQIISKEEISHSKIMLNDFINEYESLYTVDSMLSNVHGHLHFLKQLLDFSPLTDIIQNSLRKKIS